MRNIFFELLLTFYFQSFSAADTKIYGLVYDEPLVNVRETSDPVQYAFVMFTVNGDTTETVTDSDGYYEALINKPVIVENSQPETFELHQNYPNPFNPSTDIPFSLSSKASVSLTIYNILGQKVRTLVN